MTLIDSKRKFKANKSLQKEFNFARVIMIMNFFFLVNMIPLGITYIILNVYQTQRSSTTFYGASLSLNITGCISAFYGAYSLFIHLKFNKIFYKEFVTILVQYKYFILCKKSIKEDQVTTRNSSNTISKTK